MKQDEESADSSIFSAWKVLSKLYNAIYCSRGKKHECASPDAVPTEKSLKSLDSSCSNTDAAEVAEEGEAENHDKKNTIERSSELTWFDAVKEQQVERVKEFITKGVNVNDKDELGWSALHIAAWNNYADICDLLLTSGADVNLVGPGSSSPLSLAAQRGHTAIIKQLLQAHCDVAQTANIDDSINVTALHLAAQHGHSQVVCLLIEAGAIVNATMTVRGINGITPLHLAVQNEHLDVMDILINAGCDVHSSTQPCTLPGNSPHDTTTQESLPQSSEQNTMESSC